MATWRNIGDKVRVRLLGEVFNGKIVEEDSNNRRSLYQVWLDNGKHTTIWFADTEVMDPLTGDDE